MWEIYVKLNNINEHLSISNTKVGPKKDGSV
jgi:hypothetical protein